MPRFDGIAGMFVAVIRKVAFLRQLPLFHPRAAGCGLGQKGVEPDLGMRFMGPDNSRFVFLPPVWRIAP